MFSEVPSTPGRHLLKAKIRFTVRVRLLRSPYDACAVGQLCYVKRSCGVKGFLRGLIFKMLDDCDWKRVQKAVFPCLLASLPVSVDISVIECTQQIANICKHHTLVSSAGTRRSWSIRDWQWLPNIHWSSAVFPRIQRYFSWVSMTRVPYLLRSFPTARVPGDCCTRLALKFLRQDMKSKAWNIFASVIFHESCVEKSDFRWC